MNPQLKHRLLFMFLTGTGIAFLGGFFAFRAHRAYAQLGRPDRIVFLAGNLSDENLICLTASLASWSQQAVLLLDSPPLGSMQKNFLQSYQPDRIIPIGTFQEETTGLARQLGIKEPPIMTWTAGPPWTLWKERLPRADEVVLCPAQPRRQLLQAACLAGASRIPLFVVSGLTDEESIFRKQIRDWKIQKVYAIGEASGLCKNLKSVQVIRLPNAEATARAHRKVLSQSGPIENLVVANPADSLQGRTGMSVLAPWIAIQHGAALLLTNDQGTDAGDVIREALRSRDLRRAETLTLVGDLTSLPMERRPNPIAGKDQFIEMEPMTPSGSEPFTLATGRLFADEVSLVPLVLARQRQLSSKNPDLKALVVSNPSGGLPLLETFSRNTTKELANTGYQTTALFNHEVNPDHIRQLMPDQDVFLWEGHYATLTKEYKMQEWTEPMKPSLVFLQSCLALADGKAQPFLQRGAVSVIGTSTRTYSATGGACALAFFDALLYDRETVGGSLRQAKNFLLAYSLLKEKRLGKSAKLTGANLRSAWAFSLWGDPTLKFPCPQKPENSLPSVRQEVHGHTIIITLPEDRYHKAISNQYQAQMSPNGRLAGLITLDEDEESIKHLVPFIFAEVHLPQAPPGQTPHLRSRLPDSRWVFNWDARRNRGYLLFMPRSKDQAELRFYVDWHDKAVADTELPRKDTSIVQH